ncbi:phosphoribosyltransferase [Streptomyces sp. NBC_00654]|uniref:phosphoribosyltransferase n=1 Tax=Streptomyces sp. NBC_00654 TaxID=2975799 RepID=UPI002257F736|nr:phosphoribosyltransferase [Streptomyces sp. NBC_00654]MCX4963570.1 phosphoribosyltransferase [Streptomyces sp. NBC_00654]
MLFTDRTDAGLRLAHALRRWKEERPVVLGLPRGGVPVAYEVARELGAPLDVIVVRKLGVPYHRELGFGAIGEDGVRVLNEDIVRRAGVTEEDLAAVERTESAELARRAHRFRDGRPRRALEGRTVIVVDDGIATGSTARAACAVVRAQGAARVVLAVPVAPPDAVARLREGVDEVVCLAAPQPFSSVGEWYRDFSQTSDDEVVALLARAAADRPLRPRSTRPPAVRTEEVRLAVGGAPSSGGPAGTGGIELTGDLVLPDGAGAVVMFAHGSGSSRHSPRNRSVAASLNEAGLGTLLFDLLTPVEAADHGHVFDIGTLAGRLSEATRLLRARVALPIGYFGASTGAAAALRAASEAGADIGAVVSRGGRPDLAGSRLGDVRAPTLLVVGGLDTTVLALNQQAGERLTCENRLEIVPGASHLFEEPGALDRVADLARDWFTGHLLPAAGGRG